jgi:hypothetical protein
MCLTPVYIDHCLYAVIQRELIRVEFVIHTADVNRSCANRHVTSRIAQHRDGLSQYWDLRPAFFVDRPVSQKLLCGNRCREQVKARRRYPIDKRSDTAILALSKQTASIIGEETNEVEKRVAFACCCSLHCYLYLQGEQRRLAARV